MSGGRFLVSLREVQSSEKISCIKSLIKEDINSWDERVEYDSDIKHHKEEFMQKLSVFYQMKFRRVSYGRILAKLPSI